MSWLRRIVDSKVFSIGVALIGLGILTKTQYDFNTRLKQLEQQNQALAREYERQGPNEYGLFVGVGLLCAATLNGGRASIQKQCRERPYFVRACDRKE
jgi:hypothetical protein